MLKVWKLDLEDKSTNNFLDNLLGLKCRLIGPGFTVYVSYYISKYIIPNYYPSRKIIGNYKHTKILGFGQGEPSGLSDNTADY